VQLGLPASLLAVLRSGGGGNTQGAGSGQANAKSEAADDRELVSPIEGNLVKWLVEDGTSVEEGDAVAVLEAMKMETNVVAHRSGALSRDAQEPGARIARSQVLATID